ncbi:PTS sugar transporter subunit IIA [Cognatiluteimonas telluris]|jgi:PTS system nitrogen regulatory IIA component|uniref:PTS sugar transporter subunit IIA n=1 Tax=Cognatiluteimonas telluris TaxID=1104775 RepID=UPI00140DA580|nr:PTS sugar transporter subunit IIA [Lysobacter telluris]
MSLSEVLAPDRIVVLTDAGSRDGVLDAAARLLAGPAGDGPAGTIAEGLRQRERMGSTAIGHGVAIPHGRIAGITRTRAAFLRLQPPIDFTAADGAPVDLVLAMAAPEHFTQQHLQLLSQVAERFADPEFRAALRDAPDVLALRGVLGAGIP